MTHHAKNTAGENYIETIHLLSSRSGHAHVSEIAKATGVRKPSVTQALSRLKQQGFIDGKKYGAVTLTRKGSSVAGKLNRQHKLIKDFLIKTLGIDKDTAEKDACIIEHHLSSKTLSSIRRFLNS